MVSLPSASTYMVNELMRDLAIVLENVEVLSAGGESDFLRYGLHLTMLV